MAGFFLTANAQNRPSQKRITIERRHERMELRRLRKRERRHHRRRQHRIAVDIKTSGTANLQAFSYKPDWTREGNTAA